MRTDMTPEVIRAAEQVDSLYSMVAPCCKTVAAHILANRSDYDAEGVPLEVDEGFCRELGGTPCIGRASIYFDFHGFFVERNGQGEFRVMVGTKQEFVIAIQGPTRPQLRALIEAMGR